MNNNNNNNSDKPNLKQSLAEAVEYMGPGLIAALGQRDPVAISNAYTQSIQQLEKDKEAEFNRQLKIEQNRLKDLDKVKPSYDFGFVDSKTGQTLKIDKNSGRTMTMGGQIFDRPEDIMEGETYRQKQILPHRVAATDQGQQRIDLAKQKTAGLSDKQVQSLSSYKAVLGDIEEIKRLKPGVNTGPFISRWNRFTQVLGFQDMSSDFVKLRTSTNSLLANYLKSISGAQVSAEEARRLYAVVPRIEDDDNVFNDKLVQFEKMAHLGGQAFLQAIASGQPLRRDQIDLILQNIDTKVFVRQIQKDEDAVLERLDRVLSTK